MENSKQMNELFEQKSALIKELINTTDETKRAGLKKQISELAHEQLKLTGDK